MFLFKLTYFKQSAKLSKSLEKVSLGFYNNSAAITIIIIFQIFKLIHVFSA